MVLRNLGKALRGKATPFQIVLAAVLGGMLGFVPGFLLVEDLGGGFMQAPGLILALLFLVLVLNANLGVFGLTLAAAKLVSLPLLGVSFAAGRVLLDGPLQGLFRALVQAPVLAWFGLEHYATTGGLLLGLLFGTAVGLLVVRAVRAFRARMAGVEEGSERYRRLASRRSTRLLVWLFLGKGKGKRSYRELLESRRKGLPVRIPGVLAVAVLVVGLVVGHSFLTGPALSASLRRGLEGWNGATVDLADARLDLSSGRILLSGFAMADPLDLGRDTFRAATVEMDLGTRDLLSRRFVVDRVVAREASTGAPRETPGERVLPEGEPPPPPPAEGPGDRTLEDYLAEARVWKERLQQIGRWIGKLAGGDDPVGEETAEEREHRIRQAIERYGMARVAATHLLTEAPAVLVRELRLEGVESVELDGEPLDIVGSHLSTNPRLVAEPLELRISARSGTFAFELGVERAGTARVGFEYLKLPVDDVAGSLEGAPVRGGTMDVALTGDLDATHPQGVWLDLPLLVRLHDTTLHLEGMAETPVEEFTVPIGLRGPLASPRVRLDDAALVRALADAGKQELARQVKARAEELLGEPLPALEGTDPESLLQEALKKTGDGDAVRRIDQGLKSLFPGKKKKSGTDR